jgi:hypothetical protein
MGYRVDEIPYIGLAEELGVGLADPDKAVLRELNRPPEAAGPAFHPGGKVRHLARYVDEKDSCSACYAALIFALSRLGREEPARLKGKIAVGQGFRGKSGETGSGNCCSAFRSFCPGCPPSGAAVLAFLRDVALRP